MIKQGQHPEWDIIVIGASSGGMKALEIVLPALPAHFQLPLVIVLHRGSQVDDILAQHLNRLCNIQVKEASDQELIAAKTAYIAPGGYHLLIEEDHTFSLCVSEKVSYSRPSVDVLFKSAADAYNGRVLAIVLTGANTDGKEGALYIKHHHGTVIAQDPSSADAPDMPTSVIVAQAADYILSLDEITQFLLLKAHAYD